MLNDGVAGNRICIESILCALFNAPMLCIFDTYFLVICGLSLFVRVDPLSVLRFQWPRDGVIGNYSLPFMDLMGGYAHG